MEEIKNMIISINQEQIKSILIALVIAISFKIFSSLLARIIIKIFRLETNQKTEKNTFYRPLRGFFTLLGIYLAILVLKEPFKIAEKILAIVNTIFRISLIIVIANGFAQGINSRTKIIKNIQNKINPEKAENNNSIEFLIKILKAIIYTIAVFLVIQELGFDLGSIIAGLGLGGVILTLAAQDTAKNLFGGVVIFLDKPFKVGDYIEAGTNKGTVEDITFRSTAIRTLDGSLLHIPNSEMSAVVITNWNEVNKRRYKTNLLITLETPLEKVEKIKQEMINMLSEQEEIYSDSIMVNFENILDSGIEVVVIAYTNIVNYREYIKVKEKLNYQIMRILENNYVQLAYNTQTIYVKN